MTATLSGWSIREERTATAVRAVSRVSTNDQVAVLQRPIETWQEMAQELLIRQIAELRDGWDGGSAHGVASRAIANASATLASLRLLNCPPDLISPSSSGTVEFEWQRGLGSAHLELGNSTFGFYTEPSVGEPIMEGGSVEVLNVEKIRDALATVEASPAAPSVADWNRSLGVAPRPSERAA